jgi:hypothetical protein
MRRLTLSLGLLLCVCSSACTSYDEERKSADSIEQSIEKFHEQFSVEQYHEIYAQADETLRRRLSEQEFIKKLSEAHARTGKVWGKASVPTDMSLGTQLRQLFTKSETITTGQLSSCDVGTAVEKFQWSIEDGKPRLLDYELRQILERGKVYAIDLPDKQ